MKASKRIGRFGTVGLYHQGRKFKFWKLYLGPVVIAFGDSIQSIKENGVSIGVIQKGGYTYRWLR